VHALELLSESTIAITGATGRIGSALTDFFQISPEITILANARREPKNRIMSPGVKYVLGDIEKDTTIQAIIPDAAIVIHCAGLTDPFRCEDDPDRATRRNVTATEKVMNAFIDSPHGTTAILLSGLVALEPIFDEKPSQYGLTKQTAESIWKLKGAQQIQEAHMKKRLVIARFGSVSDPDGKLCHETTFRQSAQREGKLTVFSPDSSRYVVNIEQVIDSICYILTDPQRTPNGSVVTRNDMPNINPFRIALAVANSWEKIPGVDEKPNIVITKKHKAVRENDHLLSDDEDSRAVSFGPHVIIPAKWTHVRQDVHPSYALIGSKAIDQTRKTPAVTLLNEYRGVSSSQPFGVFPHTFEFAPTAGCNFACPHCSYDVRNSEAIHLKTDLQTHQSQANLSEEVANTLLEDFIHLAERQDKQTENPLWSAIDRSRHKFPGPGIFIAGWGEPTAVPWLKRFIKYAGEYFPVSLCTNGSLLENAGILNPDVLKHIDLLLWSLYAPDEYSFRNAAMSGAIGGKRNNNFFQKTDRNIHNLIQQIHDNKLHSKLAIKILLSRDNYALIQDLYTYAKSFQPDRLVVRLANNFEPGQDAELTPYDKHTLTRLIEHMPNLTSQHPLRKFASIFLNPDKNYQPLWAKQCYHLTEGHFAMVDPNGDIHLSVVSDGKPKRSIGNINKNSWSDIWTGNQHKRAVAIANWEYQKHVCGATTGMCRHAEASYARQEFIDKPEDERQQLYAPGYHDEDMAFV
jgi:nucleoside-diphosphate-sugar epimerase/MoaA/NifB/PqqE/SkfB family radical SAM enzyme